MLFKKKLKSPFEEILARVDSVNHDLIAFVKDKTYQPTDKDFRTLRLLSDRLHEGYALAGYTDKRLR